MKARQFIIAVAVLAVLTGIALTLRRDPFEKPDRQSFSALLPQRAEGSIDKIVITNKEGAVSVEKRGDGWWIIEPRACQADENGLKAAASYLERLAIVDIASRKKERQGEYGLTSDSPEATQVKAFSKGTEVLSFTGGKLTPDFKGSFVALASAPEMVYTTSEVLPFIFGKGVKDWRSKIILDVPKDDVEYVQVANGGGSFELEKDGEGKWHKKDDPSWIPDPNRVAQLTGSFTKLLWTEVLDEPDPAADYGFGKPQVKAALKAKGKDYTLLVGKETDEPKGNIWIRAEGDPKVYQVRKGQVERWMRGADYYSDSKPELSQKKPDQAKSGEMAQQPEQTPQGTRGEVKEQKSKAEPSKSPKAKPTSSTGKKTQ